MPAKMNPFRLRVKRHFSVPCWDATVKWKAQEFWSERRMVFSETSETLLLGKRGNLIGNLTSFDMSRLMARLTITVQGQEVQSELVVNTFGQSITQWNRAWWDLEMEIFESFLLRGDEQQERWLAFHGHYKKAAVAWSLSMGAAGDHIRPEHKP